MPGKIFVNYRRDDERSAAARVRDRLTFAFGASNVFMDVDNLTAGQRFDKELEKALVETDIFIAVMGPRWMELFAQRQTTGERDYVREEIATALKRGIVVIPVLIENARLPRAIDLPEDVRDLVLHQKHSVTHERFGRDVIELVEAIQLIRESRLAGRVHSRDASNTKRRELRWPVGLASLALVVGGLAIIQAGRKEPAAPLPQSDNAVNQVPASLNKSDPLLLKQIKAHASEINGVAFTEDGALLVSASRDASIKIWDAADGTFKRTLALKNWQINTLAVLGHRALVGNNDGTIGYYDLDRGEKLPSFKVNDAPVWSIAFIGSPERFVVGSHDWNATVWNTRAPLAPPFVIEGHDSAVLAVAYSKAGPRIATGSADRTVRIYDADNYAFQRSLKDFKDFVSALAFSPDGRSLAVGALDGVIRIYSAQGKLEREMRGHKGRIEAFAYSPDGRVLASAGNDSTVRLWDIADGRTMRTLGGYAGGSKAVAFAPDGKRIASAGGDGIIRIWSVPPISAAN